MRQARNWFMSAIKLDPNEAVAQGFIHLVRLKRLFEFSR